MIKKEISITSSIRIKYTICGILWILNAICIWVGAMPIRIISSVCLIAALLFTLFIYVSRREKSDEMADYNLHYAKSFANSVTVLLLSACVLIVSLATKVYGDVVADISVEFLLDRIVFPGICFVLGVNHFIIGIIFKKMDEE